MDGIRATLLTYGIIDIPTQKDDWLDCQWWRRRNLHRSEALLNREDMVFTDKMATENPKRFFAGFFAQSGDYISLSPRPRSHRYGEEMR